MPEFGTTTAEIEGTTDQDWVGGSPVQRSVRDPELTLAAPIEGPICRVPTRRSHVGDQCQPVPSETFQKGSALGRTFLCLRLKSFGAPVLFVSLFCNDVSM
jgi:hypothetical protein